MNGDIRAVWIATWQAARQRSEPPGAQNRQPGCCLAKQLCLEAQPNKPSMFYEITVASLLFPFGLVFSSLNRGQELCNKLNRPTHQPHTTMHHSFIAVSHVDLSLTSIKKSVMEGTFAEFCECVSLFFFGYVRENRTELSMYLILYDTIFCGFLVLLSTINSRT